MNDDRQASAFRQFEQHVWTGNHDAAVNVLLRILGNMSGTAGRLPELGDGELPTTFQDRRVEEVATRMAAAIGELFTHPEFSIDEGLFLRFMGVHRWICVIFAASSFGNADFVLQRLRLIPHRDFVASASGKDLMKLCILYGAESSMPMDFSILFKRSPPLACSLAIAILSNRLLATSRAHEKREVLLRWLAEALDRLDGIAGLPTGILADLWMHCSYGLERDKHDLKRPLNRLLRRQIHNAGIIEPALQREPTTEKPTVFVMLEWFHEKHSIMRTHSISMKALRKFYKLVGFGPKGMVDDAGKALFDEFHTYEDYSQDLRFIKPVLEQAGIHRPLATYFPSVGMALHSIYLVNIRFAPTQIIALGHPATTHSDKIDYVLVEEDYVGDVSLFSEKVTVVPKNALPYFEPTVELPAPARKINGAVKIAVPTAVMKLNPKFLETCRAVQQQAQREVEFHFMLGGAPDLVHSYATKAICQQVPNAVVHMTSDYEHYMANIAACDMFANPFPFGNTNGIVDTVYCGLPGICWTGDEVHSHIDEGMFRRLGFPSWTITQTYDEYISAALRMIDDTDLRMKMSEEIRLNRPDKVLFTGNPGAFADVFTTLVSTQVQA